MCLAEDAGMGGLSGGRLGENTVVVSLDKNNIAGENRLEAGWDGTMTGVALGKVLIGFSVRAQEVTAGAVAWYVVSVGG